MSIALRDKILIVEDDPGIGKFLKANLTANSYDVVITETAKSALAMISSHCPDCILLDLGLPDLDGNQVIQNVRGWTKSLSLSFLHAAMKTTRHVPWILVQTIT